MGEQRVIGIAGVISDQEPGMVPSILQRMLPAISCRENCPTGIWTGGGAGLAAAGPGAEYAIAGQDGLHLAVAGFFAEDETINDSLFTAELDPAAYPKDAVWGVTAQMLLELYRQRGIEGLQGLNGTYVVAIWDEPQARLTLVTDRYGIQPCFYGQRAGEFVFATRALAVAAHPRFGRQVNPAAVYDLLASEQMLDERTLYADIQALPPAAVVMYEAGRLDMHSYWQPRTYQPGGRSISEEDAAEGLAGQVLGAVARQLQRMPEAGGVEQAARLCLLLTGGLDSRLLAAALARCRGEIPASAVTIGHEQARDVRYGREIARATGLDYTVLPANPHYLADYAAESVRRTDGGINVHTSWVLEASDYLRQNGISGAMTGVGAEAVSGRHWLAEQPVTTRQAALERLLDGRWEFTRAARLLRPEIRAEAEQVSRESVRRTLADAPGDDLMGWADYFTFRQNRRHPSGNILAEDALVLEPFFDNHLVDYAYALPPVLRYQGALYKKMIVERFPEVAEIKYTDSGTLLTNEVAGRSGAGWWDSLDGLKRRVTHRLARRLPFLRPTPYGDKPAQAIYYNHWLRGPARPFVRDLLAREELYGDFLDAAAVHRLVDAHMAGQTDDFRLIGGVVTFALWRELAGL